MIGLVLIGAVLGGLLVGGFAFFYAAELLIARRDAVREAEASAQMCVQLLDEIERLGGDPDVAHSNASRRAHRQLEEGAESARLLGEIERDPELAEFTPAFYEESPTVGFVDPTRRDSFES